MEKFKCSKRTVSRLWAETKNNKALGQQYIYKIERSLAHGVSCSKTTVWRWIQQGLIRAHTSAIRPDLTAPNKLLRLRFSLQALEVDSILRNLRFRSMHNTVHIDEKWFYMTKGTHRPLFGPDGEVIFDEKIGIFPFTQKVPAQRASKNRPVGTMVTKSIESVTKEVYRECLIQKMLPAIMAKWPTGASKVIYIQQDNAKPHITNDDPIWRQHANQNGFTFILVQQPPNSPDTNVNDLRWFRAIQSFPTQTSSQTINQLIEVVHKAFEELSPNTLNNVFLSLQECMVEIMKVKDENSYKLPHMKNGELARADALPLNLEVSQDLVRECISYLIEQRGNHGA
ncbi:uncharacterized protein LOC131025750 [Salvia miltiorrhiza]|uniref:uncharacterized protein LOC131025750 n=1 Tax=Salvia miltiorrhiza TaxID=226208 RepID=UPI0025AD0DCF|nr:uncharacterized protein LOC131025750 [Salvia miltiorrhiza]